MNETIPEPGTIRYAETRGVLPLLKRLARMFRTTVPEMLSNGRSVSITAARREAMVRMRARGMTDAEIARVLGVNQSTVIYHLK